MLLENDAEWSPNWQPTPEILAWFRNFLNRTRPGVWVSPGSGQIYNINPQTKTMTLIQGDPNDEKNWHNKNKKTMAALGWTVLDGPHDHPDQMAFAEGLSANEIVAELFEDVATAPFAKTRVTLQYRPYLKGDDWKWFWVLLPSDRSKAMATGEADSRAAASTAARQSARGLGVLIGDIDVIKPYAK